MPYQLINIDQKEEWTYYIQKSQVFDFYHTWFYHSLVASDNPFLFVYQEKEVLIILPLIKRKVSGSMFYDCTSVYGYAGPISNISFKFIDDETIENFNDEFLGFLKQERIICVFSRLHPLINQHPVLEKLGGINSHGRTVAINLQIPLESQREKYRKAFRSKIRQLREKGFVVKQADTKQEIKEFSKIYQENMLKVNANSSYFFSQQYFLDFLSSPEFDSKLLLTYHNNQITSGAVITFSNHIMQLHLVATKNDYLHESPMKLLIDEATILGRKLDMHHLHLGSGVGSEEDGLFVFKAGFSDLFLRFHTWQYIANESVYEALVKERFNGQYSESKKFPVYRNSL